MPAVSLISGKCQEKEPLFTLFFFSLIIEANSPLLLSYNCFSFRGLKINTFVILCQFEERNCYQIP